MILKKCVTCLEEKSLSDFNKQASQKDGHSYYCRGCHKKIRNAGYARNNESIRTKENDKRRTNIEKTRSDNRASYWRNVEKRRADAIKYSRDNRMILSVKNKARYLADPEPAKQ